jgi:ADP-heptose:LPS heptosyltransferase
MKILVVSLLRLGDIILHAQLISSLKQTYPTAEIHFLINSQFLMAAELFPSVSKWHLLDRNKIQKILVEQNQSPMAAFDRLKATVQEMNAEKYDLVLNATHNMLSVRLMDLIEAKEKRGAQFHHGKKLAFHNLWLQYFNDQFSENKGSRFHYIEILHRALDLNPSKISPQVLRTEGPIVMQVLTADEKKNWGIRKFAELKKQILENSPGEKIFALCSPAEREQVSGFFSSEEILSPNMPEAKALLQQAKLLITGDTSIQHLAAAVRCPTLALHLGSADPVKTSPWMRGAQVIQGKAGCRPCRHSEKCHQPRHLCGDSLSVEIVAGHAMQFLGQQFRGQIMQNGDHHFFLRRS